MVPVGHGIFIQFPDDSHRRELHPAKVVGMRDNQFCAELEGAVPAWEADQSIIVYFQTIGFMQQAARTYLSQAFAT